MQICLLSSITNCKYLLLSIHLPNPLTLQSVKRLACLLITLALWAVAVVSVYAQTFSPLSTQGLSMGEALGGTEDVLNLHAQPALALDTGLHAATSGRAIGGSIYYQGAAAVAVSRKSGWQYGAFAAQLGNSLYAQNQLGAAASYRVGSARLGLSASYEQRRFGTYSTGGRLTFSMGVQMQVASRVQLYSAINNLAQARFENYETERRHNPLQGRIGMAYTPNAQVRILLEASKEMEHDTRIHGGLQYTPLKWLVLRAGAQSAPFAPSAGAGLRWRALQFDYAFTQANLAGTGQAVSIGYRW